MEVNRLVHGALRYVIREEPGTWTPEEALRQGRGSCRDQAVLLIALLRSRGLAARFASGYLVQLADEGMLPEEPRGVSLDVADLYAWCEVFIPGGGWIGLVPTNGVITQTSHVRVAVGRSGRDATPTSGTIHVGGGGETLEVDVRVEPRE